MRTFKKSIATLAAGTLIAARPPSRWQHLRRPSTEAPQLDR